MMKVLIPFLLVSLVHSLPANKESFDKAKEGDIEINSIHLSDSIKIPIAEVTTPKINIDIQTTFSEPAHRNGGSFARVIDDIFQIPITVLQSVAKLLTNPFKQNGATPQETSKY